MNNININEILETYNNPLEFVQCAYPWGEKGTILEESIIEKWQKECLDKIGQQIRIKEKENSKNYVIRCGVKSGQGIGKTATICWLIQWFMSTYACPQIIVTANTDNQLKNTVWRELSKWHRLLFNKELFEWTATTFSLKTNPKEHRAVAVPNNENNSESFQGIHEKDTLIIFDEASGIPEIIYDVVEGTIKTGRCIFIAFSNPTKNIGSFREAFGKNSHKWINITVDSREVSFANKEEIENDIKENGEDSDYVRVRIKGEFPRSGSLQLISNEIIDKCINYEDKFYYDFTTVLGVDVAREGNDESVICIRQGRKVHGFLGFRNLKGKELAQKVIDQCIRWDTRQILVDGIGVGASPYDFLIHFGYNPIDVQSAGIADNPNKYNNKRAEMWGRLQLAMEENIDLPNNEDTIKLKEQIESIEYSFPNGKLQIESKKKIKKRGFNSPDRADALALTYAYNICAPKEHNINSINNIKRINKCNLLSKHTKQKRGTKWG